MDSTTDQISSLIIDLSDKNEDNRWAAAYSLAQIGAPAVDALTRALDHRDSVVRLRAAWALGRIGDLRPVDKLIATLHDGDWAVRLRAAEALGELRAVKATDALILALRDEKIDVRRHVIAALTQIADPSSADRLGDLLKDTDWRVRMGAVLALSAIGDKKSLLLVRNAAGDENQYVQKIARSVINKKG